MTECHWKYQKIYQDCAVQAMENPDT